MASNAQHHKAICNRYYICNNTDMFLQSLESQTYFIMFKHGNHWKWSATYAHTLQWITLTIMITEQTVSVTLERQVNLTTHTFDICFLLFLFLFVTFFTISSFLVHSRDNTMRCEHTCFFLTRGTSACTPRSASSLISCVVKSSCPYLSGLCSSGISACFFLKSSNKINAFTRAISRKW